MRFLPFLFLLAAMPAVAASSAVTVTPANVAVPGGETREFAARFYDGLGQPVVGENVQFVNDACGTFGNGGFVQTVRTDATGLATVTFTARNQGITCYVAASAGVQVRWQVLTFTMAQVYFTGSTWPAEPRPGQPFTVTVEPRAGAYRLYEADVTARVIPGTASAAVSPATANTGQGGRVELQVTPDARVGDYEIEVAYRGRAQRMSVKAPEAPWQDLWWGGASQNGWGVSIVQHRDMLFSVIYAYDSAGQPTWFVMPGGRWNDSRTIFSGPIYFARGTSWRDYRADRFVAGAPVGQASLGFNSGDSITFDVVTDGGSRRLELKRQNFGPSDTPLIARFDDMWWGGPSQNGWGIAVLQQHRTLFAIWFTYDESGAPTWFVMPIGAWLDDSTYAGDIFRTSGTPWMAAIYDARAFRSVPVGNFRFRFSGDTATFDYTIEGRSGTMALSRQPF